MANSFRVTTDVSSRARLWQNMDASIVNGVVAEWRFDGDLTEEQGGLDLVQVSGPSPLLFGNIEGLEGLFSDGLSDLYHRASHDGELEITGELTVYVMFWINAFAFNGDERLLVEFKDPLSEMESGNTLYALRLDALGQITYQAEQGAGVDIQAQWDNVAPVGGWNMLGLRRQSNGDVSAFLNGQQLGTKVADSPTGGTDAAVRLRVGDSTAVTEQLINGFVGGIIVANAVNSPAIDQAVFEAASGSIGAGSGGGVGRDLITREESSVFTVDVNDELIEVDINASSFTGTLPPLATVPGGRRYRYAVDGDPDAEVFTLAADGAETFDDGATSMEFWAGAQFEVMRVKTALSNRWTVVGLHYGNDANSNHMFGPHWSFDYDQGNKRPKMALGDLSENGFTSPGNSLHFPVVGPHGVRWGNNFGVAGGNNDWILRASEGNFGEGTLELLALSNDNIQMRLATIGNGNARVHIMPMDGGFVLGAEADAQPFVPANGSALGFMVRNAAAQIWHMNKAGHEQITNFANPATATPGADANNAVIVYSDLDAIVGYRPAHDALW